MLAAVMHVLLRLMLTLHELLNTILNPTAGAQPSEPTRGCDYRNKLTENVPTISNWEDASEIYHYHPLDHVYAACPCKSVLGLKKQKKAGD